MICANIDDSYACPSIPAGPSLHLQVIACGQDASFLIILLKEWPSRAPSSTRIPSFDRTPSALPPDSTPSPSAPSPLSWSSSMSSPLNRPISVLSAPQRRRITLTASTRPMPALIAGEKGEGGIGNGHRRIKPSSKRTSTQDRIHSCVGICSQSQRKTRTLGLTALAGFKHSSIEIR
jgi:hypothetical protein